MITAVKGRIKGGLPNLAAILIAQAMIGYSVRVITRIIPMGITAAHKSRHVRQEALRDSLSAGGHLQYVVVLAQKLADLEQKLDQVDVSRLKAAADIQLRLISKYLGDVKAIEISGAEGGDLVIQVKDFKNA